MTASNIAVCLGPSIIKTPDESLEADAMDSAMKCLIVENLILNVNEIFGDQEN